MGDANSEQELLPDLGFTVLSVAERQALAVEERKIRLLSLPAPQTQFLLASLYIAKGLYAEAIEQFESLSKSLKEPALIRTLGDLYLAIDLNREAEGWYLEALGLQSSGSLGEQALTQRGLAQVYENLGILERAIATLDDAKKAYERLGDAAMVESLEQQGKRLKLKIPVNTANR
jgi:tetratricopeptide (TPR) repeat protein